MEERGEIAVISFEKKGDTAEGISGERKKQ